MKKLLNEMAVLYSLFFRIGLFSVGGGYVMLPMLRSELVEKRGWADDRELLDYYAIGQATPGIIAINTATFIGFKRCGIAGAVAATAGMVTPSLIIILLIAALIPAIQANPFVQKAFKGIRVAVAMLLAGTLISLARKSWKSPWEITLTVSAFAAVVAFGAAPVPIILAAGAAGWLFFRKRRARA